MNNDEPPVTIPVISPQDYETDAKCVNMYKYLTTDELTGNARADKTTLIMADKYTIQNVLLYRMALPCEKKLANSRLGTKLYDTCIIIVGIMLHKAYFTRWR